jgi:hypothetical protein
VETADRLPKFLPLLPLRWIEDLVVAVDRRLADPHRGATSETAPGLAQMQIDAMSREDGRKKSGEKKNGSEKRIEEGMKNGVVQIKTD